MIASVDNDDDNDNDDYDNDDNDDDDITSNLGRCKGSKYHSVSLH